MPGDTLARYNLLDSFRGLAIVWIVCFHVLAGVREQYGVIVNYIISHGYLGVSIFFIIGGYGIADTLSKSVSAPFQPHLFLLRRLKRIYPCYWWHLLFVALILPLFSALVSMLKTHSFRIVLESYTFFEWLQLVTLTKVFSSTSWRLNLAFVPLNGVLWYVAVIVQIYLFVTLCLYCKKYSSFCLFIGFVASLLVYIPAVKDLLPFGLFLPYFCQFYMGMVIHYLLRKKLFPQSNLIPMFMLLCMIWVLYYCALLGDAFFSLTFSVVISLILLFLHKHDAALSKWPPVIVFSLIGSFSYSLYLLHVPLWPFVAFVTNFIFLPPEWSGPVVLIPGIIFLSFSWYLFFERPVTQSNVIGCLARPLNTLICGFYSVRIFIRERRVS